MQLRQSRNADIDAIVALNAAVVAVTSPMDAARCAELLALPGAHVTVEAEGEVVGFALVMRHDAPYENANFQWFSKRLRQFFYVDRIVIGEAGRGQGLGNRVYETVMAHAQDGGALALCAEMDIDPPNTQSLRFHAKQGFVAMGTRVLDSGKAVSMQTRFF